MCATGIVRQSIIVTPKLNDAFRARDEWDHKYYVLVSLEQLDLAASSLAMYLSRRKSKNVDVSPSRYRR